MSPVHTSGDGAGNKLAGEYAVVLHDIGFSYQAGSVVLHDINLAVPRGSIVSVIGPSGCGKSTLLSLMASLHEPTEGYVEWVKSASEQNHHPLTMLFQRDTLLPWLTVAGNVGLHFRFKASRGKRYDAARRVSELITMAGLRGFEDRYPYELSGGMRRRVGFLSVVAPHPRVLLLDEPFSSLDEPTRVAIHQVIFDISRRLAITVVLVTHDLGEAISLSDEVIILTARPGTICDRYTVPFGRERRMLELRQRPEFLELYGKLWQQLSLQMLMDGSNSG
jgi:NitT/TauT family transport system ATP-binding protein